MPDWVHSTALRLVVSALMALAMLLSPIAVSMSHNPAAIAAAEAARHADLAAEIAAHGHSHDDGVGLEQVPGHSHGHNPADHTHEPASAGPVVVQAFLPVTRTWLSYLPSFVDLETGFRLDRPPRRTVIA